MNFSLEQEIVSVYDNNIQSFYTINQISKKLKKTYPYINKKVSLMIDESVLNKNVVGNSYLCSLNLNNEKTVMLLTLNEVKKRGILAKKDASVSQVLKFLPKLKTEITIHSVFHSKNKIYFVLEDLNDQKRILNTFSFKPVFVDKKGFQKLLLDDPSLNSYTLLYGFSKFFEFVQEIHSRLKMKTFMFTD